MKTIVLCIITAFLSISCSNEPDFETPEKTAQDTADGPLKISYPENSGNPFDSKGKLIYEALHDYLADNSAPNSVAELGAQIRFIGEKMGMFGRKTGRLIPFTDEMVQSIMDDPDNSMILIVQNSSLETYPKLNLISFLEELIVKRQQEFAAAYTYITGYESAVMDDSGFTSEEKETLLTVSSISRYSLYSEQDRKDKDWDILIGNKPAPRFFKAGEAPLVLIISLLETVL